MYESIIGGNWQLERMKDRKRKVYFENNVIVFFFSQF